MKMHSAHSLTVSADTDEEEPASAADAVDAPAAAAAAAAEEAVVVATAVGSNVDEESGFNAAVSGK